MDSIAILITGGTLDKVHNTLTETLTFPKDKSSQIARLLELGRCAYPVLVPVLQQDSLNLCDEGRAAILTAVKACEQSRLVITHGTGTMDKTAQYLEGRTGDKTVVLTGSMRPFSLGKSDAGFNVGGALIAAQTLPAGVYAVMNGRVFKADEIKKDVNKGRFD
jgi:L-asparaginase